MPSTTIPEEKAALRAQVRAGMKGLSASRRRESDDALFARFLGLDQVRCARTVLLYYGMGAEPETRRLLDALSAQGKRVLLPRCEPERQMTARAVTPETPLVLHPYGMLEPGRAEPTVDREEIDLILVPGLAFDKFCYRLGQGGGYYDRYLAQYRGVTAALCRSCFLLPRVPTEPHDRPVELVVTEERVLTK